VEERHNFLEKTSAIYMSLVKEIVRSSDQCVDKYEHFMGAHVRWRWIVIIGTGMIAVLNIIVGHVGSPKVLSNWTIPLGAVASVFAVAVTILATLEGFTNAAERAQGYRESREMFVDISEEFIWAWETYVRPLKDSAEACSNAAELLRRLVAADRELRARFKNLTMARQERGGAKP